MVVSQNQPNFIHLPWTDGSLYILERGKRCEIKNKIEKVERKLKYMLSDDKYLTSLSSPSDIPNCERGVKELPSLEEEVLKEKAKFR